MDRKLNSTAMGEELLSSEESGFDWGEARSWALKIAAGGCGLYTAYRVGKGVVGMVKGNPEAVVEAVEAVTE
jgi:hypothetical protein